MSYRADDETDGWHMPLMVLGAIVGCFAGYHYLRGGWRFIPLPQGIQNAVVGVLVGAMAGRCLAWCAGFLRVLQKYFLG